MIKPNKQPPNDNLKNYSKNPIKEKEPSSTHLKNTQKNTVAVPSLNKDSPSNIILKLTAVPISFNKATTATGSVAATIDPIVNASPQSKSL